MQWFEKNVAEAIKTAQTATHRLIVYVEDHSTASANCFEILNSLTSLEDKIYTAIRIHVDSVSFEQLKAIYGHFNAPTILVINCTTGEAIKQFSGSSFGKENIEDFLSTLPDKTQLKENPLTPDDTSISQPSNKNVNEESAKVFPSHSNVKIDNCDNPEFSNKVQESTAQEKLQSARIQLKLPSGESKVTVVNAESTLLVVRGRASEAFNLREPFDLAIPYPRRTFEPQEDNLTVNSLGLCPASTLLVLPKGHLGLEQWNVLRLFYLYLQPIYVYLRNVWGQIFRGSEPRATASGINTKIKRN